MFVSDLNRRPRLASNWSPSLAASSQLRSLTGTSRAGVWMPGVEGCGGIVGKREGRVYLQV